MQNIFFFNKVTLCTIIYSNFGNCSKMMLSYNLGELVSVLVINRQGFFLTNIQC